MISDLKSKLERLSTAPKKPERKKYDISDKIGGTLFETENGAFIVKRIFYKLGAEYGDCRLENIERTFDLKERLVFVDTETTGLGSVACPFLIGAAYYEEERLVLEQIFLRDIDDEFAALKYFTEKFSGYTVVSFNGKTFDIPLIKDRCIINSIRTKGFAEKNIDLLHLSRRIWKKRIGSCRLGNIESEILSFERENDISGGLVPEIYKEYLNTGKAEDIIKVIEHNESDVVTLTVLLAKLMRIDKAPTEELDNIFDVMHLGEYCFNSGDYEKAKQCLEAVIHTKTDPFTLYNAMKYLSLIAKKEKDHKKALYYWDRMDKVGLEAVFPLIELAKYYEHTEKDTEKALSYAEKAKSYAAKLNNKDAIKEINIRITRLNKAKDKNKL